MNNNFISYIPEKEFRQNLKNVLRSYSGFDGKIQKKLKSVGGSVIRSNGKHVIVMFCVNGNSIKVPFPVTPSDNRRGYKNLCSEIVLRMYHPELFIGGNYDF